MNPLRRLLGYALPYRGRFAAALAAMVVYGGGSAWLAWLVKPVFDDVLGRQEALATVTWIIIASYIIRGAGSYFSGFLMADVGQHVVLDLLEVLHDRRERRVRRLHLADQRIDRALRDGAVELAEPVLRLAPPLRNSLDRGLELLLQPLDRLLHAPLFLLG